MRAFVALSQEIVRKLSQREQIIYLDFIQRAFVAAQRNGIDYLKGIEFELVERRTEDEDVDADGVSNARVRRTAAELLKVLPSPAEVAEAVAARREGPSTAEIAAGLKEGVIGTTPGSQPVHVHNEVSGIKPLDDAALAEAADRALAKVQQSVARDAEILPAIGEVRAADAAAAAVGIVPATADAPVPVVADLTPKEEEIVAEIVEIHGEKAGAEARDMIAETKDGAEGTEGPNAKTEEEEEPAPVEASANPVPVVPDTTTSAKPAAPAPKPAAPKPAAKTAAKKKAP
jgi:hypothetical protein